MTYDYITDGAEIYRRSFATIEAEADLDRLPADLRAAATRMIHASGQIDLLDEDWPTLPRLLSAAGVISPDHAPTLAKGLAALALGDPKVLSLTLNAKDGRVSLGPFPLGPAPYWN